MRRRTAIIFGCGPSGLFAAQALTLAGWDFKIFSKVVRKSEMFGAQYLHKPIPGLSRTDSRPLDYRLRGSAEDYRAKVYGRAVVPFTSPEKLTGQHQVWDIRDAYDRAWSIYESEIIPVGVIDAVRAMDLILRHRPRRIFSTIPAPALCRTGHGFASRPIWAIGDAPARGVECPVEVPPMTVECNGEPNPRWYRAANVFGYRTCEWPDGPKPPVRDVSLISKPIRTDCNCFLEVSGFHRLGRYGRWEKGYLSHHAYEDARDAL